MSRRSQSHRRRTYGRRQHEVRERRVDTDPGAGVFGDTDTQFDTEWRATDANDELPTYSDSIGGYGR